MAFLGRDYHGKICELGDDHRHVKAQFISNLWMLVEPESTAEDRKCLGS
jgi:hypothetical protein